MAATNHVWEAETRKKLTLIQTELNNARRNYDQAKTEIWEAETRRKLTLIQVDGLTREAKAMESALQSHLQRAGKQGAVKEDMRELLANQKNHKERIKRIAERCNGVLKISSAAAILYNGGLMKSKSLGNAYTIVYLLMLKMVKEGIFKKSGRGIFRASELLTK